MNPAVFLDRDGTINEDIGYPRKLSEIRIYAESFEGVRLLNEAGFHIIVITNQSAVGRGWLAEKELEVIHDQMKEIFLSQGARIDAFYYCPHWIESSDPTYAVACSCRKPGITLGQKAALEFNLNLKKSFTIGDKLEDILFGHRLGTKSILVLTGEGRKTYQNLNSVKERVELVRLSSKKKKEGNNWFNLKAMINQEPGWLKWSFQVEELEPDYVASNILEAARWIIKNINPPSLFNLFKNNFFFIKRIKRT